MLYLVSVIRTKTLVGSNKDVPLHMWVEPIEREKAPHVHVFLHPSPNTFLNILKEGNPDDQIETSTASFGSNLRTLME